MIYSPWVLFPIFPHGSVASFKLLYFLHCPHSQVLVLICTQPRLKLITKKGLDSLSLFRFLKLNKTTRKEKQHKTSPWTTDLSQASCLGAQARAVKHFLLAESFLIKVFFPWGTWVKYSGRKYLNTTTTSTKAAVFWKSMMFTSAPLDFSLLQKATEEFFLLSKSAYSQWYQGLWGNLAKCYSGATQLGTKLDKCQLSPEHIHQPVFLLFR